MSETPIPEGHVALNDADAKSLATYAELTLGLEVKPGTNGTSLRAKILKAQPDCSSIPQVEPAPAPAAAMQGYRPVEGEDPEARPAAISLPASRELMHQSHDPKVLLVIAKTDDKRRSRVADVSVNGVVTRIKRGEKVDVPYRVYLALLNAVEMQAVETEEINPVTGDPLKEWQEVMSYPFTVHQMPSAEEIAAWEARTGAGFQGASRPTASLAA